MQEQHTNIIDLDLSVTKRKTIRFDKDDTRTVDIDIADMNTMSRISETYPKIMALQERASKLADGIETTSETAIDDLGTMGERLKDIDTEMRNLIDYIFDAPVSKARAPTGSMYDLFGGSFRFEHIITVLLTQYENNMDSEFKKMQKQMNKHTAKYTRR